MSRLRCRAAEANKVAHDAMRGEIAKIKSRVASEGIQSLDVVQLERILGDWLGPTSALWTSSCGSASIPAVDQGCR